MQSKNDHSLNSSASDGLLQKFIKLESSSGILLVIMALVAIGIENSWLQHGYHAVLSQAVSLVVGPSYTFKLTLHHFINDFLMAIFFLLVGLEIKRELLQGQLASLQQAALPAIAALGGMLAPALIFLLFTSGDSAAQRGWAIPSATDIAFSLGVLSLLGKSVPVSLKVFLTALAIIDDLGAILIIAFFYSGALNWGSLSGAGVLALLLAILNFCNVKRLMPYLALGVPLWLCVYESGVHATLAGVLLAFFIPLRGAAESENPLERLEHAIHPWVAFGILPIFALANGGVSLAGLSAASLLQPVALGVAAGLFVGKQAGIMLFSALFIMLGLAKLPQAATWGQLYGASLLAGIGFTMSLFIGNLAYTDAQLITEMRIGVIGGSLLSAVVGYAVLKLASRRA